MTSYRRSASGRNVIESSRYMPVHDVLYRQNASQTPWISDGSGRVDRSVARLSLKRTSKRHHIAVELLETERTYVDSLTTVQTIIIEPLVEALQIGPPILSSSKMSAIFANFADVLYVGLALLALLEARLEPEHGTCRDSWNPELDLLGDIFCQFGHYFKLYKMYCRNFTTAMKTLENEIKCNKSFTGFLEQKDRVAALRGMSLHAHLLEPVQRIPRYRLMLSAMLDLTPKEHPDYECLMEALQIVSASATSINEAIRQYETWTELLQLQKCFLNLDEPLVACPSRSLIQQGSVVKICRKSHQHRTIFLFSDCLILARSIVSRTTPGEALGYHLFSCRIQLATLQVDVEPSTNHSVSKECFLWRIVSKQKSFLVYSPSELIRSRWLQAIRDARTARLVQIEFVPKKLSATMRITSSRPPARRTLLTALVSTFWWPTDLEYPILRDHVAPIWTEDSATDVCQRCSAYFTFFRGRHHCRICGSVVCRTCSTDKFMTSSKSAALRACRACYTDILANNNPDTTRRGRIVDLTVESPRPDIPIQHLGTYLDSLHRVGKGRLQYEAHLPSSTGQTLSNMTS